MSEPKSATEQSEFADSDVFALDNIRLELLYAGAGSRVMAGVIDYSLFYGVSLALGVATVAVLALTGGSEAFGGLGGWVVAFALLAFFMFESFWFAAQEIMMSGQTLGKRALGLRTIAAQGHSASTVSLLLRNLVKMLDIIVGGWFLVLDRRSRRLGDRLGGTVVVHEMSNAGAGALRRVPQGWGPHKVRVAEELLDRLFTLNDDSARRLSEQMLGLVARDDPQFLADVPSDLAPTTRLAAAFGTARVQASGRS